MKATYTWNTDAASGTVTADDIDAALEQLVVQGERDVTAEVELLR
jgi:hypothetical protein